MHTSCRANRTVRQFVLREFERHSLGNATKIYPPLAVITGRSFPPFVWRVHSMPSSRSRASCAQVKRRKKVGDSVTQNYDGIGTHRRARSRPVPVINAHKAIVFGESPGDNLFSRADNRARPAATSTCAVPTWCDLSSSSRRAENSPRPACAPSARKIETDFY